MTYIAKLNEIQELDGYLRAIAKSNYEGEMVLLKPTDSARNLKPGRNHRVDTHAEDHDTNQ
jgi:hypothetical protein